MQARKSTRKFDQVELHFIVENKHTPQLIQRLTKVYIQFETYSFVIA
jgi:hypothetical protein